MEKSERKRIRKRIMSWALAFFTTMSAVDVSGWGSIAAHAEEAVSVGAFEVTGGTKDTDYSYANGLLTIKTDTALTIKNADPDTATTDRIYVDDGVSANVTLAGVNIKVGSPDTTAPFQIADDSTGDVTITLADNTKNQLKTVIVSIDKPQCAALQKNGEYSDTLGKLTIQCEHTGEGHICTESCGSLTAEAQVGLDNGGGIGSANKKTTANIYIKGGNISASSNNGAGIGGGYSSGEDTLLSPLSHIYISGGCVDAYSLNSGAGIGGGYVCKKVSDIYISGGCVKATSGNSGAGIGASSYGSASAIYITGGSVNASSQKGKAIGCTPKNNDDEELYLLTTFENNNNESVYVDGVEYPIRQHSTSDAKLYLYLSGTEHTIKIGDTIQEYTLSEGQFVPKVKGTDFEISPTDTNDTLIEGTDYSYYAGALVVKTEKGITVKNVDSEVASADAISIQKDVAANITLAGVNIEAENAAIVIAEDSSADVTIILADNTKNSLVSGNNKAAIQKTSSSGKLTVTCEHAKEFHDCDKTCGALMAKGNGYGAGIGGIAGKITGDLVIAGGVISASSEDGAGIGDGRQSFNNGSGIYITGGSITASSNQGAGIGCGFAALNKKMKIVISGGKIIATSTQGAGIGGYVSNVETYVTISGGSIKTTSIVGAPHNENGKKVFLRKIETTKEQDITVDGMTYPFKDQGTEDPYLYVYLTEGKHTINDKRVSYEYSSTKKELLYKPVKADLNFFIPPTMTYDGGERIFPVSVKSDAPYSDNNVAVHYYDSEGTELESAPVNAGKYFIRAYLEETEEHVSAELDLATLTIMPAELTVMDANAKDRDYDSSSKQVEITDIVLSGVEGRDDVSVKLTDRDDESSRLMAELSSPDAGTYTEVTLPELTLTGEDAANYTLIQPTGPVTLASGVRIFKIGAEIIAGSDDYDKNYGDEAFPLEVTDTNTDIDVTYAIEEGSDVISIENGVVTIKKAGKSHVRISLPESKNYDAAATSKLIKINVKKKEGYTVETINRSYTEKSGHTESIDLKTLLPADCGEAVYEAPVITGNVTYPAAPAVADGVLSYTVGQGSTESEGTIRIGVSTENYADFTITVHTKVTAQTVSGTDNPSGGDQNSVKDPDQQGGTVNTVDQDHTANGTTSTGGNTNTGTGGGSTITKPEDNAGTADNTQTVKTKTRTVTIPATKKVKGKKKKVTSVAAKAYANDKTITKLVIGKNVKKIGKRAFYGCSNIKTIIIKTEKLKESSIGADAFKGISRNAVVKVPKKLVKKYKKILRKKGLNKKIKVVAM